MIKSAVVEQRIRVFLLLLTAFIFAGTTLELWLADHDQEALQLIPFFLCGIGFLSTLAVLLRPSRLTINLLRGVMVVVALGGLLGIWLHISGNYNFEQEIRPTASTAVLVFNALKGASPLLAPGILVFNAVVALAATYYHPVFGGRADGEIRAG